MIERACDQQALIAIGQSRHPAAQIGEPGDAPSAEARIIEAQAEISGAPSVLGPRHEAANRVVPTRLEDGVGMQEQQPGAARNFRAGRELRAAARFGGDQSGAGGLGNCRRIIAGTAIGQDHFADQLEGPEFGQGWQAAPQLFRRIQRGDDDAEPVHGAAM